MTPYKAPRDDYAFALYSAADLAHLQAQPAYSHASPDMIDAILTEGGRLAEEVFAPLNHSGDREGACLENGCVRAPSGFPEAFRRFREGGWSGLPFPEEYGGQELPWCLAMALLDNWNAANLSFGLSPILVLGAVEALLTYGTVAQKQTYLEKLVSGQWLATMNLTEPQAGSDLGALTTRAERDGENYRLFGSKIFISWGDHDCAENIVHMVLARLSDAPKGTKGISLFIVPKFLPNDKGEVGARNDIVCTALEDKLGIHASPTCAMTYGAKNGAVAFLLGRENEGLACMFTMMNNARLSVGIQGLGVAERAYQQALAYARERVQGRLPGAKGAAKPIYHHPDVKRMLAEMKARIAGARALGLYAASLLDRSKADPDEETRAETAQRLSLLTPMVKAFLTDEGCRVASLGIQVHGGTGYMEATGAAQHYRDSRVLPLYEGTNGIQAMDLVFRRIVADDGACAKALLAEISCNESELAASSSLFHEALRNLNAARKNLEEATAWLLARKEAEHELLAAAASPYARLFALVVSAWLLLRGAALAAKTKEGVDTGSVLPHTFAPEFLEGQIRLAVLYCSNCLCETAALKQAATDGSADILRFEDPI